MDEKEFLQSLEGKRPHLDSSKLELGKITPLSFEEKDAVLTSDQFDLEMGYCDIGDGVYLVSMFCPMENVTPQMLEWWFWWHPSKGNRYRFWFPSAHHAISYSKKDEEYFSSPKYQGFKDNVQYPRESIGGRTATLRISFLTPHEFGFSFESLKEAGDPYIACGHVGVKGIFDHTEMCHILKKKDHGYILVSRFWLGERLKKGLRKVLINESLAKGMAEHCYYEYRYLAALLPEVHEHFK